MKIVRKICLALVICLTVSALLLGCAQPAPAPAPSPTPAPSPAPAPAPAPKPETITLEALSFLPSGDDATHFMGEFADRVTERANGELVIEWKGGPEAMEMYEQATATSKGAIDIHLGPTVFYEDRLPEGYSLHLSEIMPLEERERGFYDYMVELHKEKMNVYYLGRAEVGIPFYVFSSEVRPANPYDLAGLKIGVPELGISGAKAWGAVPVDVPLWENFTAMERGVIDATMMASVTFAYFGVHEVSNYWIDHPLYQNDLVLIVNLDVWNQVPKHLQDLMKDVAIEIEGEMPEYFGGVATWARGVITDAGLEVIEFSAADAQWYHDAAHDAGWEDMERLVGKETASAIKEMLTK